MHPVHPHPQKGLRQHRTMKAAALCEQIALVPLCGIALTNKRKDLRRAAQVLSHSLVSSARVDLRVILARAHAEERTAAAVQIVAEILAPAHRVMQERAAAHAHDAAGAERVVFRGGKNVLFFKGKLQMVLVGQLLRAGEHTAAELREIVVVLAAPICAPMTVQSVMPRYCSGAASAGRSTNSCPTAGAGEMPVSG